MSRSAPGSARSRLQHHTSAAPFRPAVQRKVVTLARHLLPQRPEPFRGSLRGNTDVQRRSTTVESGSFSSCSLNRPPIFLSDRSSSRSPGGVPVSDASLSGSASRGAAPSGPSSVAEQHPLDGCSSGCSPSGASSGRIPPSGPSTGAQLSAALPLAAELRLPTAVPAVVQRLTEHPSDAPQQAAAAAQSVPIVSIHGRRRRRTRAGVFVRPTGLLCIYVAAMYARFQLRVVEM